MASLSRCSLRIVKIILFALVSVAGFHTPAFAALELVLTQGVDSAQPVAIVPFEGDAEKGQATDNVTAVINADLQNSGRFKILPDNTLPARPHDAGAVDKLVWRNTGVESVVVGKVQNSGANRYKISFSLVDLVKGSENNTILLTREFTVPASQLRKAGHHIADLI